MPRLIRFFLFRRCSFVQLCRRCHQQLRRRCHQQLRRCCHQRCSHPDVQAAAKVAGTKAAGAAKGAGSTKAAGTKSTGSTIAAGSTKAAGSTVCLSGTFLSAAFEKRRHLPQFSPFCYRCCRFRCFSSRFFPRISIILRFYTSDSNFSLLLKSCVCIECLVRLKYIL